MSTLDRSRQSIAGGMFNTATRLAATIGLGIQTGVFDSRGGQSTGAGALDYRAYQATFWVSAGGAGLALVLWPFITIKVQGAKQSGTDRRKPLRTEEGGGNRDATQQ